MDTPKARAARAAADLVESGMTVGLGTGTTATLMLRHLGERVLQDGLRIVGVPTSEATADLARSLNIPISELDEVESLDMSLDGADEIDPQFRMIKGRGGALLREKIVASAAARRVTIITEDKRVERLGVNAPIPVEVCPVGLRHTERRLRRLCERTELRQQPGKDVYLTDGGNAIIDCHFRDLGDPVELDLRLQSVVGVFETGLFIGLCDTLVVAGTGPVQLFESGLPREPN